MDWTSFCFRMRFALPASNYSKRRFFFYRFNATALFLHKLSLWFFLWIKGASERGFNLPAARWRTLCQFQRFRWHPKGTLHILFFARQTFQLHLPLKGRSAAVMWGLARHAGPLLYKLKKPPRILSQDGLGSNSRWLSFYRVCCCSCSLLLSAKNISTFLCAFISSCILSRAFR